MVSRRVCFETGEKADGSKMGGRKNVAEEKRERTAFFPSILLPPPFLPVSKQIRLETITSWNKSVSKRTCLETNPSRNEPVSNQIRLETNSSRNKFVSKQTRLETNMSRNKRISKQTHLETSPSRNESVSKQIRLETIKTQTRNTSKSWHTVPFMFIFILFFSWLNLLLLSLNEVNKHLTMFSLIIPVQCLLIASTIIKHQITK